MVKILLLSLLIFSFPGGCSLMEQAASTNTMPADSIEQAILDHVKQNFSLAPNEVHIKKITPENLPADVSQYYVEKKSSYGNIYYNYLARDNRLYSSGVKEDFGRFLKDADFLNKMNLNETEFFSAFRVLKFKPRDVNVLDANAVSNPSDKLKPYANQLSAPKLAFENGGATYVFFTKKVVGSDVQKWEVTISPTYEVNVNSQALQKSA